MPELDLPQRQATDTLMLTGFWYRALPADRVHRHQLHKATLLEIPLVIGRDYCNTLEVLNGLRPDDWIVLNPADSLEDNQKVNVKQVNNPITQPPAGGPAPQAAPVQPAAPQEKKP